MAVLFYILWLIGSCQCLRGFQWTHHLVLDRQNMFHLFWLPEDNQVTFQLQVSSTLVQFRHFCEQATFETNRTI